MTTLQLNYIYSPYGIGAVITKKGNIGSLYYTKTDQLVSIIGLLNIDGTHAEKYLFDALGFNINPTLTVVKSEPAAKNFNR
jgi:hypothetical protein